MHPQLSYYRATARDADLRQQAERDALARAARRARRHPPGQPLPKGPAVRRRVLIFLRACSA
jgi:hypothetical protein